MISRKGSYLQTENVTKTFADLLKALSQMVDVQKGKVTQNRKSDWSWG